MVSRRCVTAVVLAVCCFAISAAPGVGVAQAAEPVAADLLGGGAPGPIPPLPLPGSLPLPENDPFYRAPSGLGHYKPGAVLRSRRVIALGLTNLLGSVSVDQLLFRSTDATGHPIAAVTTLLKPTLPAAGQRKVVSYQALEDSLTTGCAPSFTLRTNSGLSQPAENGLIAGLLGNGWDVLVPDHEGPRSEVGVGPVAGRITLDSVRAAENYGPAGLDGKRTPVGLMGYSGGAFPTTWANALASDYAPELNLVGVTAGGIGPNLEASFRGYPGPPFFGTVLGLGVALDRAYPQLQFDDLLNDHGREQAARDSRDADGCGGLVFNAPLATVPGNTRFPDMDSLLAVPRVHEVLEKVNLIKGPTFKAPSLFVQGEQDELAFIGPVDELVAANCRHGATIDYRRVPGDHFSTLPLYLALTVPFFRDRFADLPASNTCS